VSIWSLEWGYLKVSLLPSLAFHVPWPLRRCNSGLVYVSRYLKLEVGIWAQTHVNYLRFVVSYKWSQPLGHWFHFWIRKKFQFLNHSMPKTTKQKPWSSKNCFDQLKNCIKFA
jgi:hypothetical protein